MIEPIDHEHTWEFCPHCEEEVMLDAELKVQTCPNCGKRIVTCSMCLACNIPDKHYCANCCLCYQADKENEEMRNEVIANFDLIRGAYAFKYFHPGEVADAVDVFDIDAIRDDAPLKDTFYLRIYNITPEEIKKMSQEEYEEFIYNHLGE